MGQYYYWHVVPEKGKEKLFDFKEGGTKAWEIVCNPVDILHLVWLINKYPKAKIALLGDYSEEYEALKKKGMEYESVEVDKYIEPKKYIKAIKNGEVTYYDVEKYSKDILLSMIVSQEKAGGDFDLDMYDEALAYAQFELSDFAEDNKIYREDPVLISDCGEYDTNFSRLVNTLNGDHVANLVSNRVDEEEKKCICSDDMYSLAEAKAMITFNNGFDTPEKIKRAVGSLNGAASTMCKYSEMEDPYDEPTCDLPSIYDYGLSLDLAVGDKRAPYIRWQFSWGGPSDELRIYADDTIEYVFLDWFVGIGFDVTGEKWAQWAAEYVKELLGEDWPAKAIDDNC